VQLNQIFSSSVRIYGAISFIIMAATLGVVFGVLHHFKIPPEYLNIARAAVLVIGIDQAIEYATLPFVSLGAFHRFDITTAWRMIQRVGQTAGIIILLELGYGLVSMAVMVTAWGIVRRLAVNYYRRKYYSEVKFSMAAIDREKTKILISYGWISFLIVATWIVIYQTDNIVIGRFISMEAVSLYSVAGALILQLRDAINAISVVIVPTISHFEAEKDFKVIMDIYTRSTRYLYYISGYLLIALLFFGGPFILLWVGEDFAPSIRILHTLIIAATIYFPQMIANSVLFGISRHKIALYILAVEAVSNIGLSLLLVKSYGIWGVALGTAIPQTLIYTIVYPVVFYRVMNSDVKTFYITAVKSLSISGLFVLPPALIMWKFLTPDSWLTLLFDCAVMTVIMMFGFYRFVLSKDDRAKIVEKLGRFLPGNKGRKNAPKG
jgi:O-antigen/teichoic acid export membrane protein